MPHYAIQMNDAEFTFHVLETLLRMMTPQPSHAGCLAMQKFIPEDF